jgi:hypothetical protein
MLLPYWGFIDILTLLGIFGNKPVFDGENGRFFRERITRFALICITDTRNHRSTLTHFGSFGFEEDRKSVVLWTADTDADRTVLTFS